MKLTFDEIKESARGCLFVEQKDDGVFFNRFTKKQYDAYGEYPVFEMMRVNPCGARLEFVTTSENMRIAFKLGKNTQQTSTGFFVSIDDVPFKFYEFVASPFEEIAKNIKIGEKKKKKITLYLPKFVEFLLKDIELDDYEKCAGDTKKKALFFGDSITQGASAHMPSCEYVSRFSQLMNFNYLNFGVSAYYFNKDVIDENAPFDPDYVFVAYGTNDWYSTYQAKSKEEFDKRVEGFFEKLTSTYDVPIFVISPLWRKDIDALKRSDMYDIEEMYDLLCQHTKKYKNVTVVEGMKLLPHSPEFFMPDGVHPNDLGHVCYAQSLYTEISKLI